MAKTIDVVKADLITQIDLRLKDKIIEPTNDHRASYCRGTQHFLLKFVEGEKVTVQDIAFNTSDFLFVFGGAFTGLQPRKVVTPRRLNAPLVLQKICL